eukprot:1158189-Pelagomonas_calceolata.AAC.4
MRGSDQGLCVPIWLQQLRGDISLFKSNLSSNNVAHRLSPSLDKNEGSAICKGSGYPCAVLAWLYFVFLHCLNGNCHLIRAMQAGNSLLPCLLRYPTA